MKRFLISAIALAGLGGCATYDYAGGSAPGGYYSGSPRYEYSYPDGYYGGYGGGFGGSYGYGLYGGYGGYGYSPGYYGYGSSRPYYVIRPQPRPPRGDHHDNHHRPPQGGPRPGRPGDGRPRPPSAGGEEGRPRPQLPDRLRPPSERTTPQGVRGEGRPSRRRQRSWHRRALSSSRSRARHLRRQCQGSLTSAIAPSVGSGNACVRGALHAS